MARKSIYSSRYSTICKQNTQTTPQGMPSLWQACMTDVSSSALKRMHSSLLLLCNLNIKTGYGFTLIFLTKICRKSFLTSLALTTSLALPFYANANNQTATAIPKLYVKIARGEGVPANLLYAISRAESTNPKIKRVWPWTINVRGKGYYFPTREKAYAAIMLLLANDITLVDIGLMQTNWYWHKDKLIDPWRALDPQHNIQTGARILRECYERKTDWVYCAGEYHTRSNTPERAARAKKYQKNVLAYLQATK
ncbi:MAG TPA: hypothetical protein DEG65_10875 [Methylophaga sp.]|nr:hypothetical protein [Methylophaga sp.]